MFSPILLELAHKHFKKREFGLSEESRIHVDEIASKVAAFYEKVRNIVDYKEEHLLRKKFIERVLRRRLLLNLDQNISESVIKEIIRSGHLPNDSIPESTIGEVQSVVDRLMHLLGYFRNQPRSKDMHEWIMKITAHAVHETLFPNPRDAFAAELMFHTIKRNLSVNGPPLKEEYMDIQLFVAIQRTLLKVDADELQYRLLRFIYPDWKAVPLEECDRLARELPGFKKRIERLVKSPIAPAFLKLCNRYNTVFAVAADVAEQNQEFGLETKEEQFVDDVRFAYGRRFARERSRLHRLAILSVASFFLSKILLAIIVEIPVERYLTNDFSLLNTAINIIFPPFLMLLIIAFIRMPSSKNFDLVLAEVRKVFIEEESKKYVLDLRPKNPWGNVAVRFFYFVMFVISLYILSKLLLSFGFTTTNILIFVFFISLVAATGVKVHNRANELSLEERHSTFLSFIFDLFAMPFVAIGQWIISGLSRFNVLVIALNILIELPYQVFIEFLESLRGFIKNKKEEIR